MHKDNQGSVIAVTDASQKIIQQAVYDPFGKRSEIYQIAYLANNTYVDPTDRGYTGHKELTHVGITHMKGRIYDPTLGRFLQADPHIQAPENSQSYNRYSYVLNNPLNYTDPSGYFFKKLWKGIKKAAGYISAAVVAVYCPTCSMYVLGAIQGAVGALVNGGNVLTGALAGAFSAGMPGSDWYKGLSTRGC